MYVYIFILTHRTKHDQDSHRSLNMRIENKYSTLKLGYIFSKLWLFKYLSQECRTCSWYFGYSWSKMASAGDMSKFFVRLLQAYKNLFYFPSMWEKLKRNVKSTIHLFPFSFSLFSPSFQLFIFLCLCFTTLCTAFSISIGTFKCPTTG